MKTTWTRSSTREVEGGGGGGEGEREAVAGVGEVCLAAGGWAGLSERRGDARVLLARYDALVFGSGCLVAWVLYVSGVSL